MQLMPWKQQRPDAAQGAMTLRDAVNNMFDESFWDPFRLFDGGLLPSVARDARMFPSFDVAETEKEYRIIADVPGYDPADLSVQFADGVLTVRGTMQEEQKEGASWQRRHGSFVRQVRLPQGVSEKDVHCRMKNGQLCIDVRKPEQLSRGTTLPIATE